MTSKMLLGRDHASPGAVAVERVGEQVAIGIARGWRPKRYAHVDPNEDAVTAAVGAQAQMLAVADGHNGHRASMVAIQEIHELLSPNPPPADLTDDELVSLVSAVEDRIQQAPPAGPRSRTTLVLALRTREQLQWAAVGDSALLLVRGLEARSIAPPTAWFCGDHLERRALYEALPHGRLAVPANAWVVLATDGYTDYLPVAWPPPEATRAFLRGISDPARAVDALLRQARRGGAGDNVAVAVSSPSGVTGAS